MTGEDPLQQIRKYQQAYKDETLFCNDNSFDESWDVLSAYDQAIKAGYQLTQQDLEIRIVAHVYADPQLLREIQQIG